MFTVSILGGRGKCTNWHTCRICTIRFRFQVMMSMFHFCSVTERYGKMNHHQSVNQYAYWNFSEELCRTPRKHQQENRWCEKCLYNFWYCHTSKASDRVQPYSIFYWIHNIVACSWYKSWPIDWFWFDSDYCSRNRKEIHSHCQMMNGASETADGVDLSTKNMDNTASISPSTERFS